MRRTIGLNGIGPVLIEQGVVSEEPRVRGGGADPVGDRACRERSARVEVKVVLESYFVLLLLGEQESVTDDLNRGQYRRSEIA
ncbi:MAG: hypothetical protein AAFR38_01980 [Planctomycetota bacterium]